MKTIRSQTTVTLTIALMAILVVLYFFVSLIIRRSRIHTAETLSAGFSQLEEQEARRNVRRVGDAIEMFGRNLSIKAADWAQWDDTYRYMHDHNDGYEFSNLTPEALLTLRINLIAFVDTADRIIFCSGIDLDTEKEFDILPAVQEHISAGSSFLEHPADTGACRGLVLLPQNVMMIASRPILTSKGSGPSRGSLIFGRFLDSRMFNDLSVLTHLSVNCFRLDDSLPEASAEAVSSLITGDSMYIVTDSDSEINGYSLYKDIYGNNAICLHMASDRDVHHHAVVTLDVVRHNNRITFLLLVVSIVVTGIALVVVIIGIMDNLVLRRLDTITQQTLAIGETASFTGRLPVTGSDEIASLSRSINGMLEALELSVEIIRGRDEEAGAIMANVPIGLCSLDQSLRIKPHYSRVIHSMFGVKECAGMTIMELLDINDEAGKDLTLFLGLLKERPLSYREMSGLNPCDEVHYVSRGKEAWLQVQFGLMEAERNDLPDVLVVIKDMTDEKLLAMKVDAVHKENIQLKMVAENPDLYREFLGESKRILATVEQRVKRLNAGNVNLHEISAVFRGVHTIKGIAGTFGLEDVSRIAGNCEELLSHLMTTEIMPAPEREKLEIFISEIVDAFDSITILTRGLFCDAVDEHELAVRVPVSAINGTLHAVQSGMRGLVGGGDMDAAMKLIALSINRLKRIPAQRALARSLRIVPGLIERLRKDCRLIVDGSECLIDYEAAAGLNGALIHLLRNAIDHGVEPPDERIANGKHPEGKVTLAISCSKDTLTITLSDDGRGLDPEKLKETALRGEYYSEKELEKMTVAELFRLILTPGFTTVRHISDVSGRGVGLDVVLATVENLNGTLNITSEPGRGTTFILSIPECGGPVIT